MNKLFLRREFLLGHRHFLRRSDVDGQATLDTGRWEEAARQRVEGVMRLLGADSPGYDSERPPYAVFGWDILRS